MLKPEDKIDLFSDELDEISSHNQDIREYVMQHLARTPDAFFLMPASSSGKYHPPNTRNQGGLVIHTKSVFWICHTAIKSPDPVFVLTELEQDMLLASALLHDTMKYSYIKDGRLQSFDHTMRVHAFKVRDFVNNIMARYLDGKYHGIVPNWLFEVIDNIEHHHGSWECKNIAGQPVNAKPVNDMQTILCFADYLASRPFFSYDKGDCDNE